MEKNLNIYVFSDESGVFDKKHNDYYVYGGLIIFGKKSKDDLIRKYKDSESNLCKIKKYKKKELKACSLEKQHKRNLFKVVNNSNCYKFGIVIDQKKILDSIFEEKKSKQRYLDFAYIMGLKEALKKLIKDKVISKEEEINFYILTDEHTTATNGKYELREGLLQEIKYGTYNKDYTKKFKPILKNTKTLDLKYCDSSMKPLIRAADIIANRLLFETRKKKKPINLFYSIKYLH